MWLLAVTTAPGLGVVAAGAQTGAGWETYGPLGLAVLALGAFASRAYKREADRADRLEVELREFLPRLLRAVEHLETGTSRRTR